MREGDKGLPLQLWSLALGWLIAAALLIAACLSVAISRSLNGHKSTSNVWLAAAKLVGDVCRRSALSHLVEAIKLAAWFIGQKDGRLAPGERGTRKKANEKQRTRTLHGEMVRGVERLAEGERRS